MKVQWALIDLKSKNALLIDVPFGVVDILQELFDKGKTISFEEAKIIFGDPDCIKNPIGIMHYEKEKSKKGKKI